MRTRVTSSGSKRLRSPGGRGGPGGDAEALIERFGAQMLATARRYSSGADDAEDAYQRAAEIVVRHRPRGSDDELLRWLRTTVKREALAIRRHRARVVVAGEPERLPEPAGGGGRARRVDAHEQAEQLERLRLGAQALRLLKPQEVRCMLLLAEGYSYAEICERTGFSYTKVNRCLSEGKRAFLQHVAGIESGSECARLAPHLSALADDEATATDLEALRPHLRNCLACRARLREYRKAPARVAALVPLGALPGELGQSADGGGPAHSLLEALVGAAHERWAALSGAAQVRTAAAGERLQQAAELVTGQKVAAVAASAAALAGGSAVTVDRLSEREDKGAAPPPAEVRTQGDPATGLLPPPSTAPATTGTAPAAGGAAKSDPKTEPEPKPDPARTTPTPLPPSASEFGPEATGAAVGGGEQPDTTASPGAASAAPPGSAGGADASGGGTGASSAAAAPGPGEFER